MSKEYNEAKKYITGGFNSPFRSFDRVGGDPLFMVQGKGSKIFDTKGRSYIDLSLGWGPMVLGHSHKLMQSVIKEVSKNGWCFGTPTEGETLFAKKIIKLFPSMEQVRLTNSGTEAVMGAIRLARGYTGKEKIILFEGGYHGHSNDTLLTLKNGKTALVSEGVTDSVLESSLVAEFNNIDSVVELFKRYKDIAAVLIEPIPTNMGVVLPKESFLQELRALCRRKGCVLIFDEVVTGLRASLGGAQELYSMTPDITVLGKALGGGFPIGAFGARREIMEKLSPEGDVYCAGTFSGNPMSVKCGIATLDILSKPRVFQSVVEDTKKFCNNLQQFISQNRLPVVINYTGTMFTVFFTDRKQVESYKEVKQCSTEIFARYFHYLIDHGIYVSPSAEETSFFSTAHTKKDLQDIEKIIKEFFLTLKN